MKIAHINCVYGVSSTGRLVKDLIEYGKKLGYSSVAFYSEGYAPEDEAIRYISNGERNAHALLSRVSGLQGYWSARATRHLLTRLTTFNPDIVHLHVVHSNCLNLPMLFQWLTKMKVGVVVTLHDCWWFTGRCAHPLLYRCEKYHTNCYSCPADKDVCPSWFFDRSRKMQKDKEYWFTNLQRLRVVGVSQWSCQLAQNSLLRKSSITCIYNWVDIDTFCPIDRETVRTKLGFRREPILLGVATKWCERKGLKEFLWLANHLDRHARIILVGEMKGKFHIPSNMMVLPSISSKQQLAELYSIADVFVNPSKMETFGLTTAEAIACGTPAVVYDVTACPELIGPNTGCIVPISEGLTGLLTTIQDLLDKPKPVKACRAWAVERFSLSRGGKQYYQLYKELVNERG